MRTDLRVKHDVEARRMAAELFDQGHGHRSIAKPLRVPRQTVKQWRQIRRAFGSEAPPAMDGKQARYTYEQKVAAASAVVNGGATKAEAMAELGIMSRASLERLYLVKTARQQRAGEGQPRDKAQVAHRAGVLLRGLAGAVMCKQDEIWQESRYFSEARMNGLCDDGRTRGIDGPVEWARLEAGARKMLESGLELAGRVEAA